MKTPKSYIDNIKKGIITKQMLSDCLFSCNKRAKNCRDQERHYREKYKMNYYAYDKYGNEEKYRNKKNEYYSKKDALLAIIQPTCIHKEEYKERIRIYDFEYEYDDILESGDYFHSGCYYDRDMEREVDFIDTYIEEYRYYLFYDLGLGHSFHTPIEYSELEKYDLPMIEIDELTTFGKDIGDLLSNQFVDKILAIIKSGEYEFKW